MVLVTRQKKYLLIARGSSHISYFKHFADASQLDVHVIKVNAIPFLPSHIPFLQLANNVSIERLLIPHLAKKARKHPKLSKSFLWNIYKKLSRFFIKCDIAKSAALIDKRNADVVGVWNGQKQPSSSIAEAAKALGKEVVYFENGLLPNSTTCDWKGVNCENSLPRNSEFYRQFNSEKSLPNELVPRSPIATKAKGVESEALPKQYIFVPFQVETDSQIISNSPWIRSMGQFYYHLANVIDKLNDKNIHIVIKEHPSESVRHDSLHHQHERILFANQCNTQLLIEGAEVIVTVNSTVGIESLLLGKRVIALGNACYGIDEVCAQASSEEQLIHILNNLNLYEVNSEVKNGFLNCLYEHYVIPTAWGSVDDKHVEALTRRLLKEDTFSKMVEEAG